MLKDNTTIAEILPSYYWPQAAIVIITACQHRHVRPKVVTARVGDSFLCPFCLDGEQEAAGSIPSPPEPPQEK